MKDLPKKSPAKTPAKTAKRARKSRRSALAKYSKNTHSLLTRRRIAGYGVRNFSRNAWLTIAATAVMTITLLIIFATFVIMSVLNEAISYQQQKMDMSIHLKSGTSDDVLANLAGKLRVTPNVAKVESHNSREEYNAAIESNPQIAQANDTARTAGQIDPSDYFPAIINVRLKNPSEHREIDKIIAADPQFKENVDESWNYSADAETQRTTLAKLSGLMDSVRRAGVVTAILFVIISVLVVFNTIRMAIFARKDEVEIMQEIGADKFFVRGPFLVEAELYGVAASLVTLGVGYFAAGAILPKLTNYVNQGNYSPLHTQALLSGWFPLVLVVTVALGYLIGGVSARLAVRRYLK